MSPYEIIKNSLLFSDLNEEEIAEVSLLQSRSKGGMESFFKQEKMGRYLYY